MKRILWTAVAAVTVGALSASPALAQESTPPGNRQIQTASDTAQADAALAHRIAAKVRGYVRYTIFDDVNISVDRGVVTLSGRVTQPYKAKDLARIVSRVDGVLEVNNELGVLPVSIQDDRLRTSIARQIYRDPVLSRYAIHVNSLVERQKAEIIARSTFGVFNVDNQLRIDS